MHRAQQDLIHYLTDIIKPPTLVPEGVLYYFIQFGTLRDALPACRNFDFGRPQI